MVQTGELRGGATSVNRKTFLLAGGAWIPKLPVVFPLRSPPLWARVESSAPELLVHYRHTAQRGSEVGRG